MRGRKPDPKDVKLAKGETRPSRVNYEEPEVPAAQEDELRPPAKLTGAGRALWLKYARAMTERGQLRSTDMPAFLQRCQTEADIERWEKEKARRGLDRSERLSIERVLSTLRSLALRQSVELGMTSVSRSKVRTVTKGPVEKPKHERFFGQTAGKVVSIGKREA